MERKHILHYRNGTHTEKPAAGNVFHGEIAMTYTNDHEKLYLKNKAGNVVPFSADHLINDRIDEENEKMSNALGLSTSTTDDRKSYQYSPSNALLNECHTMSQSIDYLATELKNCQTLIETLKSNTYMIDAGFNVVANGTFSQETVSYVITNNGNYTVPKRVVIKKSVNDGASTQILNDEEKSVGSVTSNIEGAKERFTITVTPDLTGALDVKVEETRYLCYVGLSQGNVIDATKMQTFPKMMSHGDQMEKAVSTAYGDYIWVCVPKTLNVLYVMSNGMQVPMSEDTQEITTSLGVFTCYHTNKALNDADWNLVIKHVN